MNSRIVDAVFIALKTAEELVSPNAVILPHFPRSVQFDYYNCGPHSVYTILKYFGKHCTPHSVACELRTDEDGTSVSDIKRVLKRHGLNYRTISARTIRDLKTSIDQGYPALVSTHHGWHYSIAYGYSDAHIFIMNPSLGTMGSFLCAVRKNKFRRIWDRWAVVVKR